MLLLQSDVPIFISLLNFMWLFLAEKILKLFRFNVTDVLPDELNAKLSTSHVTTFTSETMADALDDYGTATQGLFVIGYFIMLLYTAYTFTPPDAERADGYRLSR